MKLRCPRNKRHKKFGVTAHVAEDWVVDESGNFLESRQCTEVVHQPDSGDLYTCDICGAEAVKERD